MAWRSKTQTRLDFQQWLQRKDYIAMPNVVVGANMPVSIGCYMSGSRAVYEVTFD